MVSLRINLVIAILKNNSDRDFSVRKKGLFRTEKVIFPYGKNHFIRTEKIIFSVRKTCVFPYENHIFRAENIVSPYVSVQAQSFSV